MSQTGFPKPRQTVRVGSEHSPSFSLISLSKYRSPRCQLAKESFSVHLICFRLENSALRFNALSEVCWFFGCLSAFSYSRPPAKLCLRSHEFPGSRSLGLDSGSSVNPRFLGRAAGSCGLMRSEMEHVGLWVVVPA